MLILKNMRIGIDDRKNAFIALGQKIDKVLNSSSSHGLTAGEEALFLEITDASNKNAWFTPENMRKALEGVRAMLNPTILEKWLAGYSIEEQNKEQGKIIAVIMAGNIPFVGFHDMLCVLLTGHKFLGKLSSQDKYLPAIVKSMLLEVEPRMEEYIVFTESIIKGFDAVIATGSNNSARYFNYYFGRYPHIIRKNRSSMAILSGDESPAELEALSYDIFQYFGMGCRNVSKLMVPKGYKIEQLIASLQRWSFLKDHHKFFNNYEYQKAIILVNKVDCLDIGFCLIVKDDRLVSPLAVLYFDEYDSQEELISYASLHEEEIQCIVAKDLTEEIKTAMVLPGQSQKPMPWDYADGVDTISFLLGIK